MRTFIFFNEEGTELKNNDCVVGKTDAQEIYDNLLNIIYLSSKDIISDEISQISTNSHSTSLRYSVNINKIPQSFLSVFYRKDKKRDNIVIDITVNFAKLKKHNIYIKTKCKEELKKSIRTLRYKIKY